MDVSKVVRCVCVCDGPASFVLETPTEVFLPMRCVTTFHVQNGRSHGRGKGMEGRTVRIGREGKRKGVGGGVELENFIFQGLQFRFI